MAKVGNNIITTSLSGKLGDLVVFRTRGDRTYLTSALKKTYRRPEVTQAAFSGGYYLW